MLNSIIGGLLGVFIAEAINFYIRFKNKKENTKEMEYAAFILHANMLNGIKAILDFVYYRKNPGSFYFQKINDSKWIDIAYMYKHDKINNDFAIRLTKYFDSIMRLNAIYENSNNRSLTETEKKIFKSIEVLFLNNTEENFNVNKKYEFIINCIDNNNKQYEEYFTKDIIDILRKLEKLFKNSK
jgi:hypothetical protein